MKTANVGLWSRFNTNGLSIVPSLASAQHAFKFGGVQVIIQLPNKPPRSKEQDWRSAIYCNHWRPKGGGTVPAGYCVNEIDVQLDTGRKRRIPLKSLERVNPGVFTKAEKQRHDRLLEKYSGLMDEAFDYWTEVMRWVTGNLTLNQAVQVRQRSGWSKYLTDSESGRQFYSAPHVLEARLDRYLTKIEWNRAQRVLSAGAQPPVWSVYLALGSQYSRLSHEREFIINLAIAAETMVRALVNQFIREPHNPKFADKVSRIAIGSLMADWKALGFNSPRWNAIHSDVQNIRRVFALRNAIMHRGEVEPLSVSDRRKHLESVRAFIDVGERELG